ncbi:SPC24 protein, partial [Chauna torquata]|nr:SPC24 protein [Chauna torquata]
TALRQELEELRGQSRQLEEDGDREDEVVPSAAYVTQLYYKISRIDWDYEAEPARIKGSECPPRPQRVRDVPCPPVTPFISPQVHYGHDIAQPIDIGRGRPSRCFVSDYLWSLVPTAW